MRKFKVGDTCYYQFKKSTVDKIVNGKITSLRNEHFVTSSNDFNERVVEDNERNKEISMHFEFAYKLIQAKNSINLNMPDISYHVEEVWIKACNDYLNSKKYIIVINEFANKVIDEVNKIKESKIDGVYLIRR